MSATFIFFLVIAVAVAVYFLFFKEKKQLYPENNIAKTFETVNALLLPDEDDHRFVTTRKEKIISNLKEVKKMYSRAPSAYTKEEIAAFEKLLPEVKQDLKEICNSLIELKPTIIGVIDSQKNMLKSAEEAIAATEESGDNSDDSENVMDIFEKILETAPVKIREKEEELFKLEKSIAKYKSL